MTLPCGFLNLTLYAAIVISVKFLFVISMLSLSESHENKAYNHPTSILLIDFKFLPVSAISNVW